jgi:hypothetical protein
MFILVRYQRIKNIALIKFDGVTSDFPNAISHLQLKGNCCFCLHVSCGNTAIYMNFASTPSTSTIRQSKST